FVEKSDKYMLHTKLRRGMKGYGLTVITGTKIEKFNVTVLSVLHNFAPSRDIILCKLSGLGLEKSGIIAGMSGSPIYIKDPADGKYKLIGAVAFGWTFQKEPICGVQPIAQMLAIQGVKLPGEKIAKPKTSRKNNFTSGNSSLDEQLVKLLMNPRKIDFSTAVLDKYRALFNRNRTPRFGLVPLSTPIMISGASGETLQSASSVFSQMGMIPIQAGAVGAVAAQDARKIANILPGSALAVQLVTGDEEWSAVGTATEVIGNNILAFGHPMFSLGPIQMPIGPAYVHTTITSMASSFKVGSGLKITGCLTQDEDTGVLGKIGEKVNMVPLTVRCNWPGSTQEFHYRLVRHHIITTTLVIYMIIDSATANRKIPIFHTIEYSIDIDFGKGFGKYHAENISSEKGLMDIISDLGRPLVAMMNTSLGKPVFPKEINVSINIKPVQKTARILSISLEKNTYKPGEQITGYVLLKPFRAERFVKKFSLKLPANITDGQYTLYACTAIDNLIQMQQEMPQRFKARTVKQLFENIQQLVKPKADRLYIRLPLHSGGLAVDKDELDDMPKSIAELLQRTDPTDTNTYQRSKVINIPIGYVLTGSASVNFVIKKHPEREN
ncbi:MAG: hypothetical protein J7L99_08000, partial [Planctomycetes bacterium]|nr:hypothetical protein [Planctomycetota bacterium]